ncbi:MAG: hypothetical protein QME75_00370 [Deltaproteobacteria bacterium]|nr:hypothetical protein [Deltaproteobacteria bacterium]
MNVLMLCEALAQKIVDHIGIADPAEVDFAAQPGLDAVLESLNVEQEDIAELIHIHSRNLTPDPQ